MLCLAPLRAVFRRMLICSVCFAAQRLLGSHADIYLMLIIRQFAFARKKHPASQQ